MNFYQVLFEKHNDFAQKDPNNPIPNMPIQAVDNLLLISQ